MTELVGVSKLNWGLSAVEISKETDKLIEEVKKVYDSIGSLEKADVSFENTVKVLISSFWG